MRRAARSERVNARVREFLGKACIKRNGRIKLTGQVRYGLACQQSGTCGETPVDEVSYCEFAVPGLFVFWSDWMWIF